ncbi:MAG: glycosyltransferase family 2 protein, partial [Verrucomicrobia bacterium]|nr:glycosyltransferase family 2 protein [Verrucomicrobiota bacterium]
MSELILQSVWCVVPVYNNGGTVKAVALGCREHLARVLVVDDGSTDVDVAALFSDTDIVVLHHFENRGKGAALLSALEYIRQRGGQWMVCVDADGQHNPDDLLRFFPILETEPSAIVVGARDFSVPNVPGGSKFGRKFSNFWIKLECGAGVSDSQSGFRAYPVELLS